MKENALKPLLKYPGGKTSEVEIIEKYLPSNISNYIEPFVLKSENLLPLICSII